MSSSSTKSSGKPNKWILFTSRVSRLLGANGYSGKELSSGAQQFCSSLKRDHKDYSALTDSAILAKRKTWSAPVISNGELQYGKGWSSKPEKRAVKYHVPVADRSSLIKGKTLVTTIKSVAKKAWVIDGCTHEQSIELVRHIRDTCACLEAVLKEQEETADDLESKGYDCDGVRLAVSELREHIGSLLAYIHGAPA